MNQKARARTTIPTQDHLEVSEVVEDLVLTRSGSVAVVIQTNAVNFDLLSENEQDNKIFAFAGLLNSLNFHIQILIKTQRIDISSYLNYLQAQTGQALNPGVKRQLEIYTKFVQKLIVTNDVLDKKFFIVIPFHPNAQDKAAKQLSAAGKMSKESIEKRVESAKAFLYPKRDHVIKQLARMGLAGHQLTTEELIELFYNIYNPSDDDVV